MAPNKGPQSFWGDAREPELRVHTGYMGGIYGSQGSGYWEPRVSTLERSKLDRRKIIRLHGRVTSRSALYGKTSSKNCLLGNIQ